MFDSSKKSKAIRHLQEIQSKLKSVHDVATFNVWKRSAVGAIKTYAANQTDVVTALDSLLAFAEGTGFKTGKQNVRQISRENFAAKNADIEKVKKTAETHIENIIRHIEMNDLDSEKTEKPSFWDKLDVKWLFGIALTLLTAVIGLLAIVGNLMSSGLPNEYNRGFNTAKEIYINGKQRDIDLLNNKIDSLNREINVLRDSIFRPN